LLIIKSAHELGTILTVGRWLSLLLNDLFDLESLREGHRRLLTKTIEIQPILSGVMDLMYFLVEVNLVTIVNEIPKDFPPVIADENRVIQIIYNLLHNAIKYTHEGEIRIQGKVQDDRAFITISDTGIGIEENFLQHLFHPYEQAAN